MDARKTITQYFSDLTSQNAPNYMVSATAGGVFLLVAGLEAIYGCGGYSTVTMGFIFEGLAAKQYGLDKTTQLITSSGYSLFNTGKEKMNSLLYASQIYDNSLKDQDSASEHDGEHDGQIKAKMS